MRKKPDPNSTRYTNALLESIDDKFQIIVEATHAIPAIEQRLSATLEEVSILRVNTDALARSLLKNIHERVSSLERALK